MKSPSTNRVRIWDLPTRVFHWSLALCVIALLVTGMIGGDDVMAWHARLGYCAGALLLFRLLWGFVGGRWSRFSSFAPSLARAWRYLSGRDGAGAVGHDPLGALSVYAMLAFLVAQVASGLFSQTKEDFAGPLAPLVSNAAAHALTGYHKNIGQPVLIALLSLHLAAIAYYVWRGRRLIGPMLSGDSAAAPAAPASRDDARTRAMAIVLLSVCSLVMWCVVKLGG